MIQFKAIDMRLIDKTYVKLSDSIPVGGYGAFADEYIKKGDTIFECVIASDHIPKDSDILLNYRFWYKDKDGKHIRDCIPLGNICLMNHHDNPNIGVTIIHSRRIFKGIALKDIKKDNELFFDYKSQYI